MRARNIKPGFFLNCELAEVDFASRILFIGLWCYADREGRFEWKPKQIKATVFPYDSVNIDKLLCNLMSLHFITRHDTTGYVEHFKKHQSPHPHEAKSILPEKPEQNQCHDMSLTLHGLSAKCNADVRIEDVRIVDILIPDIRKPDSKPLSEYSDDFLKFWSFYPAKTGKGKAYESWRKLKPPLDRVLFALEWQRNLKKWREGFTPNPATYLNQRRWEDEPPEHEQSGPVSFEQLKMDNTKRAMVEFLEDNSNDGSGQKTICFDDGRHVSGV